MVQDALQLPLPLCKAQCWYVDVCMVGSQQMLEILPVVALMCISPAESGFWPEKQSDWRESSDLYHFKAGVLFLLAIPFSSPIVSSLQSTSYGFSSEFPPLFINFLSFHYLFLSTLYLPSHSIVVLCQHSHRVVMFASNMLDRFLSMSKHPIDNHLCA